MANLNPIKFDNAWVATMIEATDNACANLAHSALNIAKLAKEFKIADVGGSMYGAHIVAIANQIIRERSQYSF